MKTGIIIPCYNEENRLDVTAFKNFISTNNAYHLCFVNDGSKDNTIDVLKDIQKTNPNKVSIVDVKVNAGKAAAVRAGAKYFYAKSTVKYIGFMDADLSTDFKDFENLVNTLSTSNSLSFVFGSRAKNASEGIKKDGVRAIISKMINILIVFILGLSIADTQCGAKVFETNLVPLLFGRKFKTKWLFDVEMFIRIKRYFGKQKTLNMILEQPLHRWVHMDDSKLGVKDSVEIPFRLLSIWFNYTLADSLFESTTENYLEPQMRIIDVPENLMAA
ncbi:dolichyl-phosphate beta-glucosyltransferase [Aquimarina agarilytica]|uniref:dolichyl-phosphate beta-glucosyltransferase n=1 Tax=Aquimarina agarilytica TaxID=1087449 RepID=UPI000287C559|nr:dolichyl-phosphate beta-glucosyltransferase [Aquimarina agarilytica]